MSKHFGSRLKSEVIPEWKDFYIGYKDLKQKLEKVEGQRFSQESPKVQLDYPIPKQHNNNNNNTKTDEKPNTSSEMIVRDLAQSLEQGILRSDRHFRQGFSELQMKLNQICEANSAALNGTTLSGESVSGGTAATITNIMNANAASLSSEHSGDELTQQQSQYNTKAATATAAAVATAAAITKGGSHTSISSASAIALLRGSQQQGHLANTFYASEDGIFHERQHVMTGNNSPSSSPRSLAGQQQVLTPNVVIRSSTSSQARSGAKNVSFAFPSQPIATNTNNTRMPQEREVTKEYLAKNDSCEDLISPMMPPPSSTLTAKPSSAQENHHHHQEKEEAASITITSNNNNNDNNYHLYYSSRNSIGDSIFDAVLRTSQTVTPSSPPSCSTDKEKQQKRREADLSKEDVQLSLLVEIYESALKLYRFLELNHLGARRIWHKYEKYVLNPFVGEERSSSNKKDAYSYGAPSNVEENDQNPFIKGGIRIKNLAFTSPLHERMIQCERLIERVREVAEKLFGTTTVQRYFVSSVTNAADKRYWTIKWKYAVLAFIVLFILLAIPIFPDNKAAHNCAAMLGCVVVLWVSEAIPFFTTAMLIPLLAVPLMVLPGKSHKEIGEILLGNTFDHVQILVLGGLCMGKGLAKHKMELALARYCLAPIAHRPRLFVLVLMFLAALSCVAVSNVAAPVLVLNVVQPTLWRMDRSDGGPQVILLAIAFACNAGGMLGPLASPQNAVALKALGTHSISYAEWLGGSLPIVTLLILSAWALLLTIWKPFQDPNYVIPVADGASTHQQIVQLSHEEIEGDELAAALLKNGRRNNFDPDRLLSEKIEKVVVLTTCLVTLILWIVPLDSTFGDAGVVALLPIVVFFGIGILSKDEFNTLSWPMLFLLAGGNMLSVATKESGLLRDVISSIKPFLANNSAFAVTAVLILFVALITTFVSHTVASLILMPVIVEIATVNDALPSDQVLVFLSILMCSGSMMFPISSFPNVNSLLAQDERAQPYLEPKDFLLPGGILSLISVAQLISFYIPLTEAMFPK